MKKIRAFTLIEVMVALFILALTFMGVISTSSHVSRTVTSLEEKTVVLWVAQNAATEINLGLWGTVVEGAHFQDEVMMAGKRWRWKAVSVSEGLMQRVTVDVISKPRDTKLTSLSFLYYLPTKETEDEQEDQKESAGENE